ncbi:MAG: nucleotidyltransferase family protein [Smithella sp.]|nr:nucleotidyltransferase family protein [Smithella sp.]
MKSSLLKILSPLHVSAISLSSADFAQCVELARRHGVEMLFYSRLQKYYAGSDVWIGNYLQQTRNAYLMAVARSLRQEATEKNVVTTLGRESISVCIIKGNEIARIIYEDPNCRSSVDIDVLVRQGDVTKADFLLRAAGYKPEETSLEYLMLHKQHAVYQDPAHGNMIELHWHFGIPYFFKLSSMAMWKEVIIEKDGRGHLSPEMFLILLLIHHHNHSFSEFKILVDLLWAFNKYDEVINWDSFAAKLKKFGLTRATLISISQMEGLWQDDVLRLQSIGKLKLSLTAMDCKVPEYLISYFKFNLDRSSGLTLRDKIAGRFALDGLRTTFLSYLKTACPPPDAIQSFYHCKSSLMLPVNYLRFILWRVKHWTGLA